MEYEGWLLSSGSVECLRKWDLESGVVGDPDSVNRPLKAAYAEAYNVPEEASSEESGALTTASGSASACLMAKAAVPGTSPWLEEVGSSFSMTVVGTGDGLESWECLESALEELRLREPSGMTSSSSGTASWARRS